ncbi:MAG: signal peptidase II [endosymbiont of Galathealinum brachiosum]|uniref:Lipoprotein signal peptidase n=1 Tax=endosymbiont of Galathealinum brachiosum TaxID=2200906 RepID=A0A370DCH7_9GAMM|nr:MAG: signal peptidase II [endosymbiont of Galathealinum brachiosum]
MPDSNLINTRQWIWISILVIVFDQLTKLLADHFLQYHQPIEVMPMFNLTLMYNKGAAFSFLANAGGWQRWFFLILTSAVSIFIYLWIKKLKSHQILQYSALALILGGAIGNLIDRAIYGHVIDFLDVYFQHHHWPAFNIADSAITVGAILLIYDTLKNPHEDS